mgnify:FL=1
MIRGILFLGVFFIISIFSMLIIYVTDKCNDKN